MPDVPIKKIIKKQVQKESRSVAGAIKKKLKCYDSGTVYIINL